MMGPLSSKDRSSKVVGGRRKDGGGKQGAVGAVDGRVTELDVGFESGSSAANWFRNDRSVFRTRAEQVSSGALGSRACPGIQASLAIRNEMR